MASKLVQVVGRAHDMVSWLRDSLSTRVHWEVQGGCGSSCPPLNIQPLTSTGEVQVAWRSAPTTEPATPGRQGRRRRKGRSAKAMARALSSEAYNLTILSSVVASPVAVRARACLRSSFVPAWFRAPTSITLSLTILCFKHLLTGRPSTEKGYCTMNACESFVSVNERQLSFLRRESSRGS